jgi:hypothetical protein
MQPPEQTLAPLRNEQPPVGRPDAHASQTDPFFSRTLDYNARVATALGYSPSPLKCDLRAFCGTERYPIAPPVDTPLYAYRAK